MGFAAPLLAGLQIGGQLLQAGAQQNSADYQAQVARNNATIARQNAEYSSQAGAEQAMTESLKGANEGGQIKAGQAANNIDVNSGSAVKVQEGQREIGQLNTLTVENNALLQAYGYKAQATNFTAEAGLDQSEANNAWIGGVTGAAGSLLSDSSALGFKWGGFDSGGTTESGGTGAGGDFGGGINYGGY